MELIVIFTALTLLGWAMAWSGHRSVREIEQTVRLAIEKGAVTDADAIARLREPIGMTWVERLAVLGLLILFVAAGIVLAALVLATAAGGIPVPLFALAAFTAAIGAGLIVCGRWLRRARERR